MYLNDYPLAIPQPVREFYPLPSLVLASAGNPNVYTLTINYPLKSRVTRIFFGHMALLTLPENWYQNSTSGALSPEDMASIYTDIYYSVTPR